MSPSPPARRPSPAFVSVCAALAVALVVGLVLHPVLFGGFIGRDVDPYLRADPEGWSLTWQHAADTFEMVYFPGKYFPGGSGGYYQPLTALSLLFDAWLTGNQQARAFQFHLTNLALHLLNVLLVFELIKYLGRSTAWAALLALLFGLHPVQVESVAWVTQRMTLLGTFFALLALFSYLRFAASRRIVWLAVLYLFYAAAVLSKPTFLILPIVLLVLDLWPIKQSSFRQLIEKLPLLALMAYFSFIQAWINAEVIRTTPPGIEHVDLIARNLGSLILRLIWPAGLSPFYPTESTVSSPWLQVTLDSCLIILLFFAAVWTFRRRRPVFAAIAATLLVILPGLWRLPFTDRLLGNEFLYPAIAVLLLFPAAWLGRRRLATPALGIRSAFGLSVAICAVFAFTAWRQAPVWQDGESVFRRVVEVHPRWIPGYIGLVRWYHQAHTAVAGPPSPKDAAHKTTPRGGQIALKQALACVLQAQAMNPDHPSVQFYLGKTLLMMGEPPESALPPLRNAFKSNPDWIDCRHYLGVALLRLGQIDEAIEHLEVATELDPDSTEVHCDLGAAYLEAGWPAAARREFQLALKAQNQPRIHFGLAKAWAMNGVPDFARMHLAAAVARDRQYACLAGQFPPLQQLASQPGFLDLIQHPTP